MAGTCAQRGKLAELPQFLGDWLQADRGNLAASLARFTAARTTPSTSRRRR
jgi:hypothetical protein